MPSFIDKCDLILKEEERFAFYLALEVVERPKLSIWMVLIPFIFLFYFHQYRKVADGRKGFVRNYLVSRKRALEEVLDLVQRGRRPEMERILGESSLPEGAKGPFSEFFSLLLDHYADLLRADGPDVESLVRSAYRSRTNYLLFLNRLNQAEKALHKALRHHMAKGVDELDDVVRRMEVSSERLRREGAERIFA